MVPTVAFAKSMNDTFIITPNEDVCVADQFERCKSNCEFNHNCFKPSNVMAFTRLTSPRFNSSPSVPVIVPKKTNTKAWWGINPDVVISSGGSRIERTRIERSFECIKSPFEVGNEQVGHVASCILIRKRGEPCIDHSKIWLSIWVDEGAVVEVAGDSFTFFLRDLSMFKWGKEKLQLDDVFAMSGRGKGDGTWRKVP